MNAKYLSIIMLVFAICFSSCVSRNQQSHKASDNETMSSVEESIKLDKGKVISLIKEDEEKRNIWSFDFKKSASSPFFYEAICDEGLYLYRVVSKGEDVTVYMLEDANIGYLTDPIDDYTQYEHNGYYVIINDSMVDVIFDEWYRNYCQLDDSNRVEHLFHVQCTHCYKFVNMEWMQIKADTIIMVDEREQFCGDEIKKHIY